MKNENAIVTFTHALFGDIRIIDQKGNAWFVATDVAKALGYERPNDAIHQHCRKVNKINYGVLQHGLNIIPESDLYRLIMKSQLPSAEKFQDWVVEEVLPSIRKTGGYQMEAVPVSISEEAKVSTIILESAIKTLMMNDVSKISCYKKLCENYNISPSFLPQTLPRPVQTLSATELLKRTGKVLTIHQFNQKMLDAGLLEIQTRPSTKGKETRKFKALTEKGLQYGENSVNPDYPLETHPHYFTDKFSGLVQFLMATIHKDILED